MILAAFSIAGHAQQAAPAGDPAEAHKKIAMCEGCHGIPGYRTAYPNVYSVPKLGGQSAVYISNALHAYKAGQRKHPSMRGIAASLSDKDIADLAAYYSTSQAGGHK
ncbi:MAG TPA: cytochrome c [Burkholderiales bacterium]|nr:cytochrome c [Burkholderiales bacterium]